MLVFASIFAAEFDQREAAIYAAVERGETRFAIARLEHDVAPLIGLVAIEENSQHWINTRAAQYYGLDLLTIE